jgi:hypothetical protein
MSKYTGEVVRGSAVWDDYFCPNALLSRRGPNHSYLSQARGVVCYLAVDELDYMGDDVARSLRISGRGVSDCRERGRKILDKPEIIGEYLA